LGELLIGKYYLQSVAKIEEIHTVPPRLKYGQVKNTNENAVRLRIKNSNLPLGTTERFTKNVLPIALDTVGALAPWEFPDEQQMIDAWNLVFGSRNDHPIADGDVNSDLFTAAKGLVRLPSRNLCCVDDPSLLRSSEESPHGFTNSLSLRRKHF
jgi:hypothetical protein